MERAARSGDGGSGGGGGGGEWKDLYKRRLQIHGGTPHPSGMVEEELPAFLQEGEHQTDARKKVEEPRSIGSFKPWNAEFVVSHAETSSVERHGCIGSYVGGYCACFSRQDCGEKEVRYI